MLAGTKSDRILEVLRRSTQPLDDDQLSERAEIGSWQQVNRICRQLEQYGRIRRIVGPDQRIVNEFVIPSLAGVNLETPEPAVLGAVLGTTDPTVLASLEVTAGPAVMSTGIEPAPAVRHTEHVMLDLLGDRLGVSLEPVRIAAESGAHVDIDGADPERTVLAACWTQRGRPSTEQEHRLLADALKLSWIAAAFQPRPSIVLCFGDQRAAEPFLPSGANWAGHALRDLGMTVVVVDLPPDIRSRMRGSRRVPLARRGDDD
ncbi:MAG: hypothetical protein ABW022_20700 [Actinoplanes sp.]